jgi:hypothetical protein
LEEQFAVSLRAGGARIVAVLEKDFDKDLVTMQEVLARLRREYDLFFAGTRRDPPYKEAKELETLVRKWRTATLTKLTTQFRLQTFLSSYTSQTEMWNKWMRQKEEGLAKDPRLVAAVRKGREIAREVDKGRPETEHVEQEPPAISAPQDSQAVAAATAPAKSNGADRQLYDEFISAKLCLGENSDVDFGAFERKLEQQREGILKKYEGHDVHFSVVSKDGKVSLKAKVVKRKESGDG